ncbi:NAD(P)-dependent oxidoreductase [Lewinella cohaerens]|uniref:NAD(P)-dependent oxidoreductase n=1 Tax=Lewinella cohaerens TaxID=70995 RepID=UPI00037750E6|nr:NAD(P)-dependent oxidoreductase [Lewinella cohaerens]
MKITFIGLGIMGSRMAANLLKTGTDLTVYNRSSEAMQTLVAQGATAATSITDAVKDADIVFSMLSTPEVVQDLFFGPEGALAAMQPEAIWADCTTVNPSFSREAALEAQQYGIRFADTPVAGTKPQAQNAELVFFAGGDKATLATIAPYLETMGAKTIALGSTGQGASFKMLVNIMLAQSMIIFSEAVILGEKMGLDKDFLLDTLPNLAVAAPFTKFKAEMVRQDNYEVQFPLEWMQKDLHLAALTAYEHQQPLYLANLAKELFAAASKQGMSRLDFAAIHRYLETN